MTLHTVRAVRTRSRLGERTVRGQIAEFIWAQWTELTADEEWQEDYDRNDEHAFGVLGGREHTLRDLAAHFGVPLED